MKRERYIRRWGWQLYLLRYGYRFVICLNDVYEIEQQIRKRLESEASR